MDDDFEFIKTLAIALGTLSLLMFLGALLAAIVLWLVPSVWQFIFI